MCLLCLGIKRAGPIWWTLYLLTLARGAAENLTFIYLKWGKTGMWQCDKLQQNEIGLTGQSRSCWGLCGIQRSFSDVTSWLLFPSNMLRLNVIFVFIKWDSMDRRWGKRLSKRQHRYTAIVKPPSSTSWVLWLCRAFNIQYSRSNLCKELTHYNTQCTSKYIYC